MSDPSGARMFLILVALASAAKPPPPAPRPPAEVMADTAAVVLGKALASSDLAWTRMQELCDDIGHRLTGSPQLERAISWAIGKMRADGLSATPEPVQVQRWIRGDERLTLLGDHPRALPMLGLGMSVGTPPEGLEAEVISVQSFEQLAALGEGAVRGKAVLFDVPFTDYGATVQYRGRGAIEAAKLGAVFALVRSVSPTSLATPHTGAMRYQDGIPAIPAAAVDLETAAQLTRMAARGKNPRVRLQMSASMAPDTTSHNAVGELRGRERPDEVVVVGCHLDSWDVGTGAQDDAAGCVAAMEAGRILASLPQRPRRTVRVVLFTNEENGLAGGRAYAQAHEKEKIVAAIEMDTGAGPFLGYRVDAQTGGGPDADERERARLIEALSPMRPLFAGLGDHAWIPSYAGADVGPLIQRGSLGFGLHMDTTEYWPIHHTQADTLDKINRDHFQRDIAGMALLTWVLAEWPDLPVVSRAATP